MGMKVLLILLPIPVTYRSFLLLLHTALSEASRMARYAEK